MHRSNGNDAAGDDILSALINAEVEGEALTDEEFRYFIMILVLAGNETTRTASNHGMRLLIENPDQFQLLIDNPDLVDDAVEEILRYNTPVACMRRTAMEDVELAGEQIKAGDKMVMFYQSANHDELVFSEPEKFDVTRQQREEVRNGHRAFGVGEHFCLGSHLARLELQIMFRFIVNHIRNPRHDGDMVWLKSNFINGIKSMPIAYDVVNA
jgi:cholest-4-en-3-one 26-monooxygenase